jgi:glycosyltransferase involved in cell wall biosynthesis
VLQPSDRRLELAAAGPEQAGRERLRHIALFMADLSGGGAERMMVNLAAGLANRGLRVDLVLADATGPYLAEVPDNVRLHRLEAGRVLRALPRLAAYLRNERPQVLLTTLHHSSVVALLARRMSGVTVPLFIREANTPSARSASPGGLRRKMVAGLIRRLYHLADGVIAVSGGVAADTAAYFGLPASKIHVLYNPVVSPDIPELAAADPGHPWLEPGQPPVVVGMGRLHPQKDFPTLLRAFARVRRRHRARLMILGEGPERPALERLAAELLVSEDVSFPGFVPNPFAYLAHAGVFVLSSRWEGLPGALIQALACGCPAVATDCPSGPAEVLEDGSFGRLVPVGDDSAMATAIEAALDAPRCSDRLRGRSRAFGQDEIVTDYVEFFESRLCQL